MAWSVDDAARLYQEHVAATAGTPAPAPPRPAPADPVDEQVAAELGDLAPPGCTNPYVLTGVEAQILELAATLPGGRNTALFVAAKALGRLAEVDRAWLRGKLKTACELNGYTADDGMTAVNKTIRSAFKAADELGDREVPDGPIVIVREVPMSTFGLGIGSITPITAAAGGGSGGAGSPPTRTGIFELEGDFWERDSLAHIYDAALMRMTPPWGVLAHCVARALHLVSPKVQLPPLVGGNASLNWFAAVAARSGGGKSSSSAVAGALVKGVPDVAIRNMGSGEGIAAAFRPPKAPDIEALMFLCEEIDTMIANAERQASTTMSTLRNAFMGDPPGQTFKNNMSSRPILKHEYRMTLIVGVQPGRAGALLEDYHSGTLQRFQWFPGFDPRCTRSAARPREFITSLPMPAPGQWTRAQILDLPAGAEEEIMATRELSAQDLIDAVDGHKLLVREKFAFGLALLDDRTGYNDDDWRRSGIAMDISDATRRWVEVECHKAEREIEERKGERQGVARSAAEAAKVATDDRKVAQAQRRILSRLGKVGIEGKRELQQHVGMLARWYNVALLRLVRAKLIEEVVDLQGKQGFALCQQT